MDPVHTHTKGEKKKIYDASVAATSSIAQSLIFICFSVVVVVVSVFWVRTKHYF